MLQQENYWLLKERVLFYHSLVIPNNKNNVNTCEKVVNTRDECEMVNIFFKSN